MQHREVAEPTLGKLDSLGWSPVWDSYLSFSTEWYQEPGSKGNAFPEVQGCPGKGSDWYGYRKQIG